MAKNVTKAVALDQLLRDQLQKFLDWQDAHVGFDVAVKGIPPGLRGRVPPGFVHSLWDVVEHIRLAQKDILDFCRNPRYRGKKWPDDYWPKAHAPRTAAVWNRTIADFRRDRRALQR